MGRADRRLLGAAVLALLAGAALAACGSPSGQGHAGGARVASGPGGGPPPGGGETVRAFDVRARQVVAAWRRSPAARVWRSGLVLLSPGELTSIPGNAGFAGQLQKDAFDAGRYTLAGRLPSARLTGPVTWDAGGSVTVPLLTAQATFRQLADDQHCPNGPCGHLTVTGARPADLIVATSRGQAAVPAWSFTVAELPFPVTRVALAPGSYASLPAWSPGEVSHTVAGAAIAAVSADERVLTLRFLTGACDTGWGGLQYPTATAVVIGSWSHRPASNTPCSASAVFREATVRLAQALGRRVILDAATGFPVVPDSG
jgi:hypothetical protein